MMNHALTEEGLVWLSLLGTHGIQEPKDRCVAADAKGKSEDDDTSEAAGFPEIV